MNSATPLVLGPVDLAASVATARTAGSGDSAARLALLDDVQEWPSFGRSLDGDSAADPLSCEWESQVVLEGIHCAACALVIERDLLSVPGVSQAQVNAATRRARVVWDPGRVRPSRWMSSVEASGYRALPARDALSNERRQHEQRRAVWRLGVAGFCMMQVMMYAVPAYVSQPGDMTADVAQLLRWASWVLTLPVMFFSCTPFFVSAWRALVQRRVSMDLPVALGLLATFAVSSAGTFDAAGVFGREVYFDSLTMFVFFLLTGRWLELRLRDRTAGALEALMNRLPDSVDRQLQGGDFERVVVRRLQVGDVIRVLPGEGFPVDGEVLQGLTLVDEALLTGESAPVQHGMGSHVAAGSHNLSAPCILRVTRLGRETRFAEIVALMEAASLDKPRLAQLADRLARPFLLGVLLAAVAAGAYWWPTDPGRAMMVAVSVLIVTCPCALSLATPSAMLAAAGALARRGVLVRNLQALETLAGIDTVVFDKTGTLTRDGMAVSDVRWRYGVNRDQVLSLGAALAAHSLHPVSRAICAAAKSLEVKAITKVTQVEEVSGLGLRGQSQVAGVGSTVRLGSARWCGLQTVDDDLSSDVSRVHLADNLGWLASFDLHEDLRPDAAPSVDRLQRAGLTVSVLSGDKSAAARRVASLVGIDKAQGDCTPSDKLRELRQAQANGHRVAMVGDGLNDGPVLAGAHVSFAFGEAVPLARASADFVVMGSHLGGVPDAIELARRTMAVVRQNLFWAAAYNAVCVPLAVLGWLPAWLAGLGMALSSLIVVLNAARLSLAPPATRRT